MRKNAIILNTIARAMNAGGSAIVTAFDAGVSAFNCTMSALSPGEKAKLRDRIKVLEKKIQELYVAIAKETSRYPDPAAALESESVIATLGNIKVYNDEIEMMKQRIAEIDKIRSAQKPQQESAGVASTIIRSISGLVPGEKASLKQKTAEKSGTDSDKPKLVEKKSQPESTGVAKFFLHAITDSISGYLPVEKSTQVRTEAGNEKMSAQEDNGGASEVNPIDFARTKPCLTPTPTPQPPTIDETETASGVVQDDSAQGTDSDAAAIAVAADVPENIDPESRPPADVETVGSDEVEITQQEDRIEISEPVVAEAPPEPPVAAVEENLPVEQTAPEAIAERAEVAETKEVEVTPEGAELAASADEVAVEKENLAEVEIPHNEFESIRRRNHTTSFAAAQDAPDAGQAQTGTTEAAETDKSGQVFRARKHQPPANEVSAPAEILAGGKSVTFRVKRDSKKAVPNQKSTDNKRR